MGRLVQDHSGLSRDQLIVGGDARSSNSVREVKRILWAVLGLNLLVAFAKLLYGVITGSLGMQADGFHSLFDGVSNVVGLVGLWMAAAPPDDDHPYGHKKYETLAAAAIGAMLVATCVYLLWNSYGHWRGGIGPQVTPLSFGVMIVTMVINYGVMRWERRKGIELRSEILLADSRHTASDILTSFSVIGGLIAVQLGYPSLDPIVAVAIAAIIARTAVVVLSESARSLTDMARLDSDEVRRVVMENNAIRECHGIRTRGLPNHIFVDLSVDVDPGMSVAKAHELAHQAEHSIKAHFNGVAEVIVHVEPDGHP
ncbi:MAG: cation diffusion facilitator family transporter [Nitrospiraceae bacterium]